MSGRGRGGFRGRGRGGGDRGRGGGDRGRGGRGRGGGGRGRGGSTRGQDDDSSRKPFDKSKNKREKLDSNNVLDYGDEELMSMGERQKLDEMDADPTALPADFEDEDIGSDTAFDSEDEALFGETFITLTKNNQSKKAVSNDEGDEESEEEPVLSKKQQKLQGKKPSKQEQQEIMEEEKRWKDKKFLSIEDMFDEIDEEESKQPQKQKGKSKSKVADSEEEEEELAPVNKKKTAAAVQQKKPSKYQEPEEDEELEEDEEDEFEDAEEGEEDVNFEDEEDDDDDLFDAPFSEGDEDEVEDSEENEDEDDEDALMPQKISSVDALKLLSGMSDEDDEDDEADSGDDEEVADIRSHNKMLKSLEEAAQRGQEEKKSKKDKKKSSIQKLEGIHEYRPRQEEGEFNLVKFNPKAKVQNDIQFTDLIGSLQSSSQFGKLQQEISSLAEDRKILAAPISKVEREKLVRGKAFETVEKEVSEWQDTVNANRTADHLEFPMNAPGSVLAPSINNSVKLEPKEGMEMDIDELLRAAGATAADISEFKALQHNERSTKDRKKEAEQKAKLRSLIFYEQTKLARINKIKSKSYRAKLKEGRDAKTQIEIDNDPEKQKEMAEKRELSRVEERLTMKHKNSSKWVKSVLRYGDKSDATTNKAIADQLILGQSLREKRRDSDDESDDNDVMLGRESDDEDDQERALLKGMTPAERARYQLQKIRTSMKEEDGKEKKGLLGMKFMQRAIDKQRTEARASLEEMEDNLRREAGEDVEEKEDDLANSAVLASARRSFDDKKSKSGVEAAEPKAKKEKSELQKEQEARGVNTTLSARMAKLNEKLLNKEKTKEEKAAAKAKKALAGSDDEEEQVTKKTGREAAEAATRAALSKSAPDVSGIDVHLLNDTMQSAMVGISAAQRIRTTAPLDVDMDSVTVDADNEQKRAEVEHAEANEQQKKIALKKATSSLAASFATPAPPSAAPPAAASSKKKVALVQEESGDEDAEDESTPEGDGDEENPWLAPVKKTRTGEGAAKSSTKRSRSEPAAADSGSASSKKSSKASKTADEEKEEVVNEEAIGFDWTKALDNASSRLDEMDRKKDKNMDAYMSRAFASDNVMADFESQKESITKKATASEAIPDMPGWGAWAGDGIKHRTPRIILEMREKAARLEAEKRAQRQDVGLKGVILNEKKSDAILDKYQPAYTPNGFTDNASYEKTLRLPLGAEWNATSVYRKLVKPRISTKAGIIIDPLQQKKDDSDSD